MYVAVSNHPYRYIAFRDIMAMLLLGFGYLMTFLKTYGLGAVGLTMMLSALAMELNVMTEWLARMVMGEVEMPLGISVATLIDSEFAAATLMITFGALIGRASPLQMMIICCSQSFFYAFNKVVLVLGVLQAEDVGGSMTIHSTYQWRGQGMGDHGLTWACAYSLCISFVFSIKIHSVWCLLWTRSELCPGRTHGSGCE
jgi:Ammonium Transporter Family